MPDDNAQAAFDNFVQLWTTGTTEPRRADAPRCCAALTRSVWTTKT